MDFPIYATHSDRTVWYKIISDKHFIEWRRLGPSKNIVVDNFVRTETIAEDYSTALYIRDLIESVEEGAFVKVRRSDLPESLFDIDS